LTPEIEANVPICRLMSIEPRESPAKMPPGLANVPAFPAVAIKLLPLFADEECSVAGIVACVAIDPALSGRLIKWSNTADQPCYCETRSVSQAVMTLGVDRTREITLAIATSIFANSAIQSKVLRPCWDHTLACALAAAEVARQCGLRPLEIYTAALLHDIGRLGLLSAYPAEYEHIVAEANWQPDDLLSIERERFGVDHVEAGVWLARRWNLPESIVEVIARHHEKPTGKWIKRRSCRSPVALRTYSALV
jgi:putative nucleotidyltransferase with HDIG domain